jgi:hypothetical protein
MRKMFLLFAVLLWSLLPVGRSHGQQYFTDETLARLPNRSDASNRVLLLDAEGDGDLDILVANTGVPGGLDRLFLNDGSGYFVDGTSERLPFLVDATSMIAAGDLDGDGDPDLLACNAPGENRLLVNDGTGEFGDETEERVPAGEGTRFALLGDLDADCDLDILAAGYRESRLLLNDGGGYFAEAAEGALPAIDAGARAGLLEDFDSDGDLDVAVGFDLAAGIVLANDGAGFFEVDEILPAAFDTMRTRGLASADVDGDGDADIVTANFTRDFFGDRLFCASGDGGFTDVSDSLFPWIPEIRDEGTCPVPADFDADGLLDLFVSKYEQSLLLAGDSSGAFIDVTEERLPADATTLSTWADCGDVDGDGDPDLVISNLLQRTNLYMNQSTPDTTAPFLLAVTRPSRIVKPGRAQEVRLLARDEALGALCVGIFYSVDGCRFEEVPCFHAGGSLYLGEIPGERPGSRVRYYVIATDGRGNTSAIPPGAPDSTYSYLASDGTGAGAQKSIFHAYPARAEPVMSGMIPHLKRTSPAKATIEAMRAYHSKPPSSGSRAWRVKITPRFRTTPTTEAVIAARAALSPALLLSRSMYGAPRNIMRSEGTNVTHVARKPPMAPANDGERPGAWR